MGFSVQDVIGLILAILIVAILVSIILILRESARERRRWTNEEEEEGMEGGKFPFLSRGSTRTVEGEIADREVKKRKWSTLSRPEVLKKKQEKEEPPESEEGVEEAAEETIEEVSREERVVQEEVARDISLKGVPKEETKRGKEPKQVIVERALRKIEEQGIDFGKIRPVVTEEMISFSPLLWEVKEEVHLGKELGEIVIHTVFRTIPGYSGEEIVERYRSGDVSIVEKLEARIRTPEGRDFLVATLNLEYFHVPELERELKKGNLEREEYELLRALKFVDRNTKKEFARTVYAQIVSEEKD
ncbi:MAG: hypothetical protein ACUVRN_01600 [Candidatus Caldatribacteriaceae bacterium]